MHELQVGERVMALLPGGGYAEKVAAHAGSAMRVPEGFAWEEAGAFPETFLTAFLNLFILGGAGEGSTVLVHGGGSGVGTSAIALCREAKVRVIVTAGSDAKCARCRDLGAEAINYHTEDFRESVLEKTGGRGVDVILDMVGGGYIPRLTRADGARAATACIHLRRRILSGQPVQGSGASLSAASLP